jgi:hypothetical protein
MFGCGKGTHLRAIDQRPLVNALLVTKRHQTLKINPVGRCGMRGEAAFA